MFKLFNFRTPANQDAPLTESDSQSAETLPHANLDTPQSALPAEPIAHPVMQSVQEVADTAVEAQKATEDQLQEESNTQRPTIEEEPVVPRIALPEQDVSPADSAAQVKLEHPRDKGAKGVLSRVPSVTRMGRKERSASSHAVPIRILMGYLDNVTEQDALGYALGVAGNHFEQMGLATYEVFPYQTGYIYEVHEGGAGKAYAPSIIEYFNRQGPHDTANPAKVTLVTATRIVQLQRTAGGVSFVLLPEGMNETPTEGIVATEDMRLVINKRTGFLVASAVLFITGFLAMVLSGLLFRYQPFEIKGATQQAIQYMAMPIGQYQRITQQYTEVSKVEYKGGRWQEPVSNVKNAGAASSPLGVKPLTSAPSTSIPGVGGNSTTASAPIIAPLTSAPAASAGLPPLTSVNSPSMNPSGAQK